MRLVQKPLQKLGSAFRPPHAAPCQHRRKPPLGLAYDGGSGGVYAPSIVLGKRQVDGLCALGGGDGVDAFGAGQGCQPSPGADGCLGRQPRRANVVAGAGDNEGVAVGALVGVEGGAAGVGTPPIGG